MILQTVSAIVPTQSFEKEVSIYTNSDDHN